MSTLTDVATLAPYQCAYRFGSFMVVNLIGTQDDMTFSQCTPQASITIPQVFYVLTETALGTPIHWRALRRAMQLSALAGAFARRVYILVSALLIPGTAVAATHIIGHYPRSVVRACRPPAPSPLERINDCGRGSRSLFQRVAPAALCGPGGSKLRWSRITVRSTTLIAVGWRCCS